MLLVLSVRLAATIHYYLQAFAPTNMLLRHLRTRGGLKWAIPAVLVLVPVYLFAAAIATNVIADGGPGRLNILVLLFIWNALKFAAAGLQTACHGGRHVGKYARLVARGNAERGHSSPRQPEHRPQGASSLVVVDRKANQCKQVK